MDYRINNTRRLPDIQLPEFKTIDYSLEDKNLKVVVAPIKQRYFTMCQKCKSTAIHNHGTTLRYVRDTNYFDTFNEYYVELEIRVPRYKCSNCHKTYTPTFDSIDERKRMTKRLTKKVQQESIRSEFKRVAKYYGISDTLVRTCFDEKVNELNKNRKFVTPRVLGIDEVHLNDVMRGVFVDVEAGLLLELTKNNKKKTIEEMISKFDASKIEIVTMDMSRGYREAVRDLIPNALIVVDKFHVVKYATHAVERARLVLCDRIRNRIYSITDESERNAKQKEFINLNINQFTFRFNLNPLSKDIDDTRRLNNLNRILSCYPEFEPVVTLKEGIQRIYRSKSRQEAKNLMHVWKTLVPKNDEAFEDFEKLAKTLDNWSEWILNYFDCGMTNAATEGVNSLIKQIYHAGRGYEFEVLRGKILFGTCSEQNSKYVRPTSNSNGCISFIAHRNMCNTYKVTQGNGVSISALNDYFFDSNGELYPAIYNQADDRKVICFDDNYYGQMYEQMSLF